MALSIKHYSHNSEIYRRYYLIFKLNEIINIHGRSMCCFSQMPRCQPTIYLNVHYVAYYS